MRLGLNLGSSASTAGLDVSLVLEADRLGDHSVWSAEAYGADAVSPIAWVAARTDRICVGTAIMQSAARTPTLTATTAMTLDLYLGGGKEAAAAAVPDALVDEVALCGPRERIRERRSAWTASGATTLICAARQPEAVRLMAELAL